MLGQLNILLMPIKKINISNGVKTIMKQLSLLLTLTLFSGKLFCMEASSLDEKSPLRLAIAQSNTMSNNVIINKSEIIIQLISKEGNRIAGFYTYDHAFLSYFKALGNIIDSNSDNPDDRDLNISEENVSQFAFEFLTEDFRIFDCLKRFANDSENLQKEIVRIINGIHPENLSPTYLFEIFNAVNFLDCHPLIDVFSKLIAEKARTIENANEKLNFLKQIEVPELSVMVAQHVLDNSSIIKRFKIKVAEPQIQELENTEGTRLLALSTDGKYCALGIEDGVHIFDIEARKNINTIEGMKDWFCCTFSPNEKEIAIAFIDNSNLRKIEIFNFKSGKKIKTFDLPHDLPSLLVYSPNGYQLVARFSDATINVFDIESGKSIISLSGVKHYNPISFCQNGRQLVTGYDDNQNDYHSNKYLKLWDIESGNCIKTINTAGVATSICCSPDTKHIATGSDDGVIKIWDIESGNLIKSLSNWGGYEVVKNIFYLNNGKQLAVEVCNCWTNTQNIFIWEIESENYIKLLHKLGNMHIVPDGQLMVSQNDFSEDPVKIVTFNNPQFNEQLRYLSASHAVVLEVCALATLNKKNVKLSEEKTALYNELPEKLRDKLKGYVNASMCIVS
jgi:WD40 repeat protein